MNGREFEPRRVGGNDRLKPDLALRAGIGEHDGTLRCLEALHHLGQQLGVQMSGPWKTVHGVGGERFHLRVLGHDAAHESSRARAAIGAIAEQRVGGGVEVAERGGHAPRAQLRADASQAREGQLHLRPTFGGEQLMPLVDHDATQVGEDRFVILAAQQQRERFGCGDQRRRQAVALSRTPRSGRIPGARLDGPRKSHRFDRLAQRLLGVGGQCAKRGNPQHPQRGTVGATSYRTRRLMLGQCFKHRPHPRGVRFAGAGGSVDESRFTVGVRAPHVTLECEGSPSARGKPLLQSPRGVDRGNHRITHRSTPT